jgi:hypothetical protein
MALTDEERVGIKHHLGYPNPNAIETFVLGVPALMESLFVVEGAMNAVSPQSEERVRKTLRRLEKLDEQIEENADALLLTKADEVEFRDDEFEKIHQRYVYWQGQLCNLLGLPGPNPYDARWTGAAGGINIGVQHG